MPEQSTPAPITRETFISPDHVKTAAAAPMMWVMTADGESTEQVSVPASIRETGIIPAGFSIDFILDPDTVVKSLANQGITTVDQLSEEKIAEITAIINAGDNLSIIPTPVYEAKRRITHHALEHSNEGEEEEEEKK